MHAAWLQGNAPLEKGHFTWITQEGRQERWIVASCGNYTVLWNFRCGSPPLAAQRACFQNPQQSFIEPSQTEDLSSPLFLISNSFAPHHPAPTLRLPQVCQGGAARGAVVRRADHSD